MQLVTVLSLFTVLLCNARGVETVADAASAETKPNNDASGDERCTHNATAAAMGYTEYYWETTEQTLLDFEVAGINLALYGQPLEEEEYPSCLNPNDEPPFELYEDFDVSHLVEGDEDYWAMMDFKYKIDLDSHFLKFYDDKVAVKRWLPTVGFDIPGLFALHYAFELVPPGELAEQEKAILNLIQNHSDYVVKPSHRSHSDGTWVVSHNANTGITRVISNVEMEEEFREEDAFQVEQIARSIAKGLNEQIPSDRQRRLRELMPGIVIEERFTSWDTDHKPALEFKVVTIWGRVFVAKVQLGTYSSIWTPGVVHRNGTMVEGSFMLNLPGWIDWSRVVDIAERLGAHKDFFRTDIFVGVPAGSPSLGSEMTVEEKRAAARYVVNEIETTSGLEFADDLMEEITRLWIAGYKMGNYRVVPNTEVPVEFVKKGFLSTSLPARPTRGPATKMLGLNIRKKLKKVFSAVADFSTKITHHIKSSRIEKTHSCIADDQLFELFQELDISHLITGGETWEELLQYRHTWYGDPLKSQTLSFYVDKVARKRLLPTMGFDIPKVHALYYAHELIEMGEDVEEVILGLLPSESFDFVAKPSHLSHASGVWIVKEDKEDGMVYASHGGQRLTLNNGVRPSFISAILAESLDSDATEYDSMNYGNVKPGLVVEERYSDPIDEMAPPLEFKMFTIWGRLWVGLMVFVEEDNRIYDGYFSRNGTVASDASEDIPDWVEWSKLVDIAEKLGANKDMFRTDILVGVPSSLLEENDTIEDREAKSRYVVSETELYPTTHVPKSLSDEGARLWIEGYKKNIYRTVENTEIPAEFVKNGFLSPPKSSTLVQDDTSSR